MKEKAVDRYDILVLFYNEKMAPLQTIYYISDDLPDLCALKENVPWRNALSITVWGVNVDYSFCPVLTSSNLVEELMGEERVRNELLYDSHHIVRTG